MTQTPKFSAGERNQVIVGLQMRANYARQKLAELKNPDDSLIVYYVRVIEECESALKFVLKS